MTDHGESERRSLSSFLEAGTEIAGSVAGTGIGLIVGGPGGALAGAAGGPLVTRMLRPGAVEFMHRALSNQERTRVAGVVALAAERIEEKLRLGHEARHDGFFEGQPGNRSAAEEIAEGALIAAQREHEENKLPYLGNLLANIAFHPEINRAYANLLVRLAEQLSYRQMCLLALFVNKGRFALRQGDYRERTDEKFSNELIVALQETADLEGRNLLNTSGEVVFGLTDVNPAKMEVQGAGAVLYNLMELRRIDDGDLTSLAATLS